MKRMILLGFLVSLYIVPSLFALSYVSPAIPTRQNITKDFAISAEWYSEEWTYRQKITIDGGEFDTEANYTVRIPVTYNAHMQTNFSDIRFTDENGTILLDHWRESYTASTSAVFWVEVSDSISKGVVFDGEVTYLYMYYGNSEATTLSNGNATFLFYEDWSSQSLDAWVNPANQADGQTTFSVTDATQGGYVAKVESDAEDSYLINSDFNYTAPFATMFRANVEEATTGNAQRIGSGWVAAYGWALVQTAATGESFSVYDDDGNPDIQSMTNAYCDSWITFQITRDGTNAKLYADTVLIETASFAPDIIANPMFNIQVQDSEDNIYSDWVACRKFVTDEPEFDSFGSEESNIPPPEWEIIDEVTLNFFIPVDETGLNLFLVFGGLFVAIGAPMYLVKGGKDEMSTDKVFFFIIAFMLGWALFLGGIYA